MVWDQRQENTSLLHPEHLTASQLSKYEDMRTEMSKMSHGTEGADED